jgi:hypothetical protein
MTPKSFAEEREIEVDKIMDSVPIDHRRWCESKTCWCMGCVNRKPLTKQEFLQWKARSEHAK